MKKPEFFLSYADFERVFSSEYAGAFPPELYEYNAVLNFCSWHLEP
jgi:hypothetical protein